MNDTRRRVKVKLLALASAALFSLMASAPANAFCPKNGLLCFVTAKSAGSKTHQDITQQAIEELDKAYFGVPRITSSMQKALDQIIKANAEVDEDQVSSAKHFDGENASGAQARLATLKQNILDALRADPINSIGARKNLGSALHTLQDFYSHSNWVERGGTGANPDVGRPVSLAFAGPTEPTCVGFLDTGSLCANSSVLVTSFLTSGYYGGEDRTKPAGGAKCSHGGPLDRSSPASDPIGYFREGINKDTRYCDISPHSTHHDAAAGAAIAGTQQFIEDIKAEITFAQLKALLGAGPVLAFAIDTTGSMGSIIAGVRATAISMVDARLGSDEEPLQYVLSPFNDPFTGPITVTNDAASFKGAISGLGAYAGGDCPELAMKGVYDGISAADEGGSLFLFTDASAKDGSLSGTAAALATRKDIKIYPALFGSCSPIDPAYLELATRTGGQVFFLGSHEAGRITQLADLTARSNAVQILSVLDTFTAPKTYAVPVDSTLRRLTVAVSTTDQYTLPTLTVKRPDGSTVLPGDARVTYLPLSRGVVLSVSAPAQGQWQVQVADSASPTYVNVTGESDLKLSSFAFAEFGGQPPHQGLMEIPGVPVGGQQLYAVAAMTEGFARANFTLRRKDFTLVHDLPLEQDETDARRFFGQVTVPGESFLAYVSGTDAAGRAFQRVQPVMTVPQTVTVTAPAPQDLRPGQTTTLIFQVTNFGATGRFDFRVTDDKGYIASVSPASFTLGTSQSINVSVALRPDASVPTGSADTITATVQSAVNPLITNSAALTLFVTGAPPETGRPDFVARIVRQERVSEGIHHLDVRFTNTGAGTARQFTVGSVAFRTLAGTGTVTYNTVLAPTLPLVTPNVDVGASITVRFTVNVPSGVARFSMTESGSVQGSSGASFAFSQAQAVIPK